MNEERFSPWEEPEETEKKPVRDRAKSIMDFLRTANEEDSEDSKDSDHRKKGKSSRWRKFFRGLFGEDKAEKSEDDTEKKKNPLILFEPIKEEIEHQDEPPEVDSEVINEVEPEVDDATDQQELESPESILNDPEAKEAAIETQQEPEADEVMAATDHEAQGEATEEQETEPQPEEEPQGLLTIDHSDESAGGPEFAINEQPTAAHTETEPQPEKSPNEHTGSGAAALLAVDYLNYRGRKKLEKRVDARQKAQEQQLKDVNEQLQKQNRELDRQKTQFQAEQTAKKREQAEVTPAKEALHPETSPPVARQDRPKKPQKTQETKQTPFKVEMQAPSEVQTTPEHYNDNEQKKTTKTQELQRQEVTHETNQPKYESINDAAEFSRLANEKIQPYSEKLHEQKNEARNALSREPSSVGSILRNNYPASSPAPLFSNATTVNQQSTHNLMSGISAKYEYLSQLEQAYYKQAALRGFVSGVVLLAIYATIKLLT